MKCKVCNTDKGNAMHWLGHHPFISDTIDVELPLPGPVEHAEAINTPPASEDKGESAECVSGP